MTVELGLEATGVSSCLYQTVRISLQSKDLISHECLQYCYSEDSSCFSFYNKEKYYAAFWLFFPIQNETNFQIFFSWTWIPIFQLAKWSHGLSDILVPILHMSQSESPATKWIIYMKGVNPRTSQVSCMNTFVPLVCHTLHSLFGSCQIKN